MREVLEAVWKETTGGGRFHALNWSMLLLLLASLLVIALCEMTDARFYEGYRGWYFLLPGLLLTLAFLGPVLRLAREQRDRALRIVVFWGLVGLLAFVATFVAAFSAFDPSASKYDRLLNVIPAVIAIWGAGLGWYAQHQISAKAHRTTHAFNLIMQTRTNSEYIRHLRAFMLVYPPGRPIPAADERYFCRTAVADLPALEAALTDENADRARTQEQIRKIEAGLAARYLLNYYEFMARGIQSGDLDAEVLYDTIGPMAIGVYNRCRALCDAYREVQPLGMQWLVPLVTEWEARKRRDAANLAYPPRPF